MEIFKKLLVPFLCIALLTIFTSPAVGSPAIANQKVYGYTHIPTGYVNNITGHICGRKPAPSREKNADLPNAKARRVIGVRRVTVSRGGQRGYHDVIMRVGKAYWADEANLNALCWISDHESTKPGVVNSIGCVGLFQLLHPPSDMIRGDAASETRAGCRYIKQRYSTPLSAKKHHEKFHWY